MPTFIKTGFWNILKKGYDGWLNLDDLIVELSTKYVSLQQVYNNSSSGQITLATNKSLSVYDTDGETLLFKVDPSLNGSVTTMPSETFSSILTFNIDKDIYFNGTGQSLTFTLNNNGNINGTGIYLKLNKPDNVTFPANFEETSNSEPLNNTKLNVFLLIYFNNWDGNGAEKIIYSNKTFSAIT